MKVRVVFTLDVNAGAWSEEFGIEPSDVREDVRSYFEAISSAQLRDVLGLAAETTHEK